MSLRRHLRTETLSVAVAAVLLVLLGCSSTAVVAIQPDHGGDRQPATEEPTAESLLDVISSIEEDTPLDQSEAVDVEPTLIPNPALGNTIMFDGEEMELQPLVGAPIRVAFAPGMQPRNATWLMDVTGVHRHATHAECYVVFGTFTLETIEGAPIGTDPPSMGGLDRNGEEPPFGNWDDCQELRTEVESLGYRSIHDLPDVAVGAATPFYLLMSEREPGASVALIAWEAGMLAIPESIPLVAPSAAERDSIELPALKDASFTVTKDDSTWMLTFSGARSFSAESSFGASGECLVLVGVAELVSVEERLGESRVRFPQAHALVDGQIADEYLGSCSDDELRSAGYQLGHLVDPQVGVSFDFLMEIFVQDGDTAQATAIIADSPLLLDPYPLLDLAQLLSS